MAFGHVNAPDCELVYVSATNPWSFPNLQYDPVMRGSTTWQIYHGPRYQARVPITRDQWVRLTAKVHRDHIRIYMGDMTEPCLVIPDRMLAATTAQTIGVWGSPGSYARSLRTTAIALEPKPVSPAWPQPRWITEWQVAKRPHGPWVHARVEENGTLNLNRLFPAEPGAVAEARCS